MAAWTLPGRETASGFNGKPKDDFSIDGNVFTGYLGMDYRLQPIVLLGLAVAYSQGDMDYETRDVTKGDLDVTLTNVLPYAHWRPRPGWACRGCSARAGVICDSAMRRARCRPPWLCCWGRWGRGRRC